MPELISIPVGDGAIDAYVAAPVGDAAPIGGLIVVHEIWGLVDHITNVADRFAAEGYLVVAPDILSRAGVTPLAGEELFHAAQSPDEAVRVAGQPRLRELFSAAFDPAYAAWAVEALRRVVDWLEGALPDGARIAVTGFCFGGTHTFGLAAADSRIAAAVPFYGRGPGAEEIATISAPVLAFYGEEDTALVEALPELEAQLAAAEVDFDAVVYPDAGHAFFNDTSSRYRAAAAGDAWVRANAFLRAHLES